jgi:hypothetical protein
MVINIQHVRETMAMAAPLMRFLTLGGSCMVIDGAGSGSDWLAGRGEEESDEERSEDGSGANKGGNGSDSVGDSVGGSDSSRSSAGSGASSSGANSGASIGASSASPDPSGTPANVRFAEYLSGGWTGIAAGGWARIERRTLSGEGPAAGSAVAGAAIGGLGAGGNVGAAVELVGFGAVVFDGGNA